MKLGKVSILLLGIGIFVVSFASIGTVHSQQLTEKQDLDKQLTQAQLNLSKVQLDELAHKRVELEKQAAETKQDIKNTKEALAQPVESIDLSNIILNTAASSKVVVTQMQSSGTTTSNLEGLPCSILSVSVKVEGTIDNIINFVRESRSAVSNVLVKSVDIHFPKSEDEQPYANIQIVAYSYQGG